MGMARGLGDGLLRLCNGAWRDNDGDAVDIVEVVRCGNCKKRPKDVEWGMCRVLFRQTHKDDFCSYGERKDNETD